jgi:hypothetical protein
MYRSNQTTNTVQYPNSIILHRSGINFIQASGKGEFLRSVKSLTQDSLYMHKSSDQHSPSSTQSVSKIETAMSGAETVVGLVLGILPLLISTAEHYETILRPFRRYRRYAPELLLYQKQLGTQKTIFRNECMLLLTTLTDNHTAKLMLKESNHPSWTDTDLDESFAQQLGDSGNACKTLIDLIDETLKAVEEEAENFGLIIQESIPVSCPSICPLLANRAVSSLDL